MNGFSTLNRLLGKKNKDVSKSTSNLSKASMDSSSQYNKIVPLPSMTNAPFEQTFRITVLLPRDQLYVARIGAKTKLEKLLELVCAEKLLDKNKYDFRHPVDPLERFDKDLTIGEVGLSEIRMVSKTDSLQSEHFNRFSSSDLYKFHKQNERESLSSSDKSRNSRQNQLLLKTTSPYSSTNSLNSMDSSGMSSSSKGGGPIQAPVAPTRKKRAAPRPPSQNSIPEKDVVINQNGINGNFKEPLPAMPRKNFHVSSPNLYNNHNNNNNLNHNNNNNNNNNNIKHTNQYFEETTKSDTYRSNQSVNDNHNYNKIDSVSVMNKKNSTNARPASMFILEGSKTDELNGINNNKDITLNAATSMINIAHSRTSSESSENKDVPEPTPRKRLLSATKKKLAPAPPPRRVVPIPSPRAAIKSEMKLKQIEEDTNGLKNTETLSTNASNTIVNDEIETKSQSTSSLNNHTASSNNSMTPTRTSPPISPAVSVHSRSLSPAISTTASTPSSPTNTNPNNVSKVMLNVDQNTIPNVAERKANKDAVNGPVSIQIVKTTAVQPTEEPKRQTSPTVSKVMLNTEKANYDSSDEGESSGSGSDKVNVYNVKMAKSITTIAQINNSNLSNSYESDTEESIIPANIVSTGTERQRTSSESLSISQRRASEQMLNANEITSLSEVHNIEKKTETCIKVEKQQKEVAVEKNAATPQMATATAPSNANIATDIRAASRSPSPLWTYTLPAPPNFADKYNNVDMSKRNIVLDNSVTSNIDTQTVTSDSNRTYIIDDADIKPVIKERLSLKEKLYIETDKSPSSSSSTSTPSSTLIDNDSNNSTDIITSDIEDGYHGGNMLHKNLLKFNHDELNKRREQLIESEFEFLTNIDDGSDDYNNEMESLNNKPNNHNNNNNNVHNNNNNNIVDKKNFINELNTVINNKDEFNTIMRRLSSNDNDDKFVNENNKRNSISNFKITTYSNSNASTVNERNLRNAEKIINTEDKVVASTPIITNQNATIKTISSTTITTTTTMNTTSTSVPVANRELINFKKDVDKLCNSSSSYNKNNNNINTNIAGDDETEKITPIKRHSLQTNPLPLMKSKSRSDSFHSTRPDYLMRSQSHNNNLNLTPRSTSYISLIGAQKFDNRHRTISSQSINRRNSATELTISQSPSLQSLEVLKNILSTSRKNSLNVEIESFTLKKEAETVVNEPREMTSNRQNGMEAVEQSATEESTVTLRRKPSVLEQEIEKKKEDVEIAVPKEMNTADVVIVPEKDAVPEQPMPVEPKKWKYQGPPMINLSTWSERPKVDVCIKSDKDYKFGGNTTLPRGFKKNQNQASDDEDEDVVDYATPHRFTINANTIRELEKKNSQPRSSLQLTQSYGHQNGKKVLEKSESDSTIIVNRLPIVRGVEYKKNVVPPIEKVTVTPSNPEVISPRNSSTYFYDNFSKPISSSNGVAANQEVKVTHSTPILPTSPTGVNTVTPTTTMFSFNSRNSTALNSKFTPVVKGFKIDSSVRNDKHDNEESDDSGFKSLPNNSSTKSISVTNLSGVESPTVVEKYFNKPPEVAKKPTVVTLRNNSQPTLRDSKPVFRMSTYESTKKVEEINSLPFSQNTLRKTGLKDRILAQPVDGEKTSPVVGQTNGNVSVTILDHVPAPIPKKSSTVISTVPPPPPPVVPVVRAVVKKQGSVPEVDTHDQLLDSIRKFNRNSLKK